MAQVSLIEAYKIGDKPFAVRSSLEVNLQVVRERAPFNDCRRHGRPGNKSGSTVTDPQAAVRTVTVARDYSGVIL